jgi:hypothetical protein
MPPSDSTFWGTRFVRAVLGNKAGKLFVGFLPAVSDEA